MSESCNQSCGSCSEDCEERKEQKTDFSEKLHEMSWYVYNKLDNYHSDMI